MEIHVWAKRSNPINPSHRFSPLWLSDAWSAGIYYLGWSTTRSLLSLLRQVTRKFAKRRQNLRNSPALYRVSTMDHPFTRITDCWWQRVWSEKSPDSGWSARSSAAAATNTAMLEKQTGPTDSPREADARSPGVHRAQPFSWTKPVTAWSGGAASDHVSGWQKNKEESCVPACKSLCVVAVALRSTSHTRHRWGFMNGIVCQATLTGLGITDTSRQRDVPSDASCKFDFVTTLLVLTICAMYYKLSHSMVLSLSRVDIFFINSIICKYNHVSRLKAGTDYYKEQRRWFLHLWPVFSTCF